MNTPKYLEIAELIRIDIFVKYVKANQLIPSIRRYAQIYNVNPNTVSRAFRLLEADDIIYSYRTRGYYVSENIQKKKEEYGRKYARQGRNVLSFFVAILCISPYRSSISTAPKKYAF